MLQRLSLTSKHRPLDVIKHWSESGHLFLDPPYQRGLVWGNRRKVNLIRSILLGIPIPSITVNDRFEAGWGGLEAPMAVIDGKQRITAVMDFLNNNLSVPGEWFGVESDLVLFGDLTVPQQRSFRHTPMTFSEAVLPSEDAEREVFDLINFGGVPQGESDI